MRRGNYSPPLPHFSAGLIFYDTKVTVMNRVLNATVQRTADHAAPEITLDPLEIVGGRAGLVLRQTGLKPPGRPGEWWGSPTPYSSGCLCLCIRLLMGPSSSKEGKKRCLAFPASAPFSLTVGGCRSHSTWEHALVL